MSEDAARALFRLDGTVALVTGSGSGIGEQIATLFARQGAAVVVGDIDPTGGRRVADRSRQGAAGRCTCSWMCETRRPWPSSSNLRGNVRRAAHIGQQRRCRLRRGCAGDGG